MKTPSAAAAALLLAANASVAGAGVVLTLPASRDTTMYREGPLSAGAGRHLFAGGTLQNSERRALVAFDVAAAVPAGATITRASLRLVVTRAQQEPTPVALFRVAAAWGEAGSNPGEPGGQGAPALAGDATWASRIHPDVAWTTPGGDFSAQESARTFVGRTDSVALWADTPRLRADVQSWLDAPATNHGWIVLDVSDESRSARRYASRESLDPAARPTLELEFTPPGPAPCNVADIVSIGGFPPADGELTVDDYTSFINAFAGDELLADIVAIGGFPPADGELTVDDYTSFINAFAEGC